jgi:hypothetical protein
MQRRNIKPCQLGNAFMKNIAGLLLLTLLTASCNKNSVSDCTPEKFSYDLLPDKKITISSGQQPRISIESGDKLVFNYTRTGRDCKNIADDEVSEILVFEIPKTDNSFEVSGAALGTINCHSQVSCFCANVNAVAINTGKIKGTKTAANKWAVEVDVTNTITSAKYTFSATFTIP